MKSAELLRLAQNEAMLVSATLVEIEVHLAVRKQGLRMIKPPSWKSHRQPQGAARRMVLSVLGSPIWNILPWNRWGLARLQRGPQNGSK